MRTKGDCESQLHHDSAHVGVGSPGGKAGVAARFGEHLPIGEWCGCPRHGRTQRLIRVVLDGGVPNSEVLPYSLAFNLFLHNSPLQDNSYCEEEMKMVNETRKIMDLPDLRFSATCVRVPVLRAHSEAVNIEFEQPFPVDEARQLLAAAPGVELIEDQAVNRFPMPTDVTGRDPVAIGRIRQDISDPNALELWLCGDQIRKGAALNAVQIAELLIQN